MKQFLTKVQKVKATCIVRSNGKVLLLRSDQVVNPAHQPRGGYFDIPSFTVLFGDDPEITLQERLAEYCDQTVNELSVVDVKHYMADDNATQVFEVVYTATSTRDAHTSKDPETVLFVALHELETYMFPQERESIEQYLK